MLGAAALPLTPILLFFARRSQHLQEDRKLGFMIDEVNLCSLTRGRNFDVRAEPLDDRGGPLRDRACFGVAAGIQIDATDIETGTVRKRPQLNSDAPFPAKLEDS